ncbi:MAG: hypothetical protein CMM15_08630, partial [Rhodospirillaceae bacterium]
IPTTIFVLSKKILFRQHVLNFLKSTPFKPNVNLLRKYQDIKSLPDNKVWGGELVTHSYNFNKLEQHKARQSLKLGHDLFIFLALSAIAFFYIETTRAEQRSSPVFTDRVILEPMSQTMPVLGRVVTNQSGIVATRIAERIEKLEVRIGDRVKKGAILARLSSDQLRQSLRLKKAELSRARAIGEKSNAEFKKKEQARQRIIALRGSTAFRQDRDQNSHRDLEMAAGSLKEAEAEVARAEAALNMAQQLLRDTLIKAPYSGIIISTHIVPGSYTRTGDPIVTMLNDDDLEIEADIPTVRALNLVPKMKVQGKLQNEVLFQASLRTVIPQENMQTRTLAARFTLDASSKRIRIVGNQSVTLDIPIGTSTRITTVHKDAILINKGNKNVYILKDNKAVKKVIKIGRSVGERFEVIEGLRPGDITITRGNERLRPGEIVKPVN